MARIHGVEASRPTKRLPRSLTFPQLPIAAGVAVAVAILAAFLIGPPDADQPDRIATLVSHSDGFEVTAVGENGRWVSAPAGNELPLVAGQAIRTNDGDCFGQIRYLDGTSVFLGSNVDLSLKPTPDGAKCLSVRHGAIDADVRPQPPGRPLVIETDAAVMEVLGTKLVAGANASSAWLEVLSGRVAMIRRIDGRRLEVPARHKAEASRSEYGSFVMKEFPAVPDRWEQNFASGLPEGWHRGEPHQVEGQTAVRAIPFVHKQRPLRFGITTENAWGQGRYALFQLHEDSVLHLRLRLQKPAPIRVMINPRPYSPEKASVGGNLYYEDIAAGMKLDDSSWHTVSVPLADISFYGGEERKEFGSPGLEGLAAYIVHLTTLGQDAGLLVEKMWVTRQGE